MPAPAARWRSLLLSGALPPAKRHGSETGHHSCVAYKRRALATIAPVCHHLLLSCSDNACGARNDPAIALCAMPRHQTHAGGTQGIPLSATSVCEPLCGRMREHGRVIRAYICHARWSQTSRDLKVSSRAGRARGYHHYGSSGHGPCGRPSAVRPTRV